jgi:ankyrin repeat protein
MLSPKQVFLIFKNGTIIERQFKISFVKKQAILLLFCLNLFAANAQESSDKGMELVQASEKGATKEVLKLLNGGQDANIATWDGMTPLHYATQNGHLPTVKALVLNGARIDQIDDDHRTPLLLAVHFNQLDIAEFLVQKDADVNIVDGLGLTPLFYAAAYGDFIMTDMFLFYKGNQKVRDQEGKTPFLAAIWGGFPQIAKLLLQYGADIGESDYSGNNALHLAVQNGDSISIDSLFRWGINVNAVNKSNLTPLELAIETKNPLLVKKLIDAGAEVNHSISKRFNTLDFAHSQNASKETSAMLTTAGAQNNIAPAFSNFSMGMSYTRNNNGSDLGLIGAWSDRKYQLSILTAIDQQLGRMKVIHQVNDTLAYQFHETRTNFTIGISKKFRIARINSTEQTGIELALRAVGSLSDYKASRKRGPFLLYGYPEIRWYLTDRFITYYCGYQYIPFKSYSPGPHRFTFGIGFRLKGKL